jgi:hypothetical protein
MRRIVTILVIGILAVGLAAAQVRKSGSCDRACLEKFADQYLAAMVAHDASKAPLSKKLIFTENAIPLPPTEGLWYTASGLGDFRFYIADPQSGQVAWVGIAHEHKKPVLLSLRIKVENGQITEAEQIVIRDVDEKNLNNLRKMPHTFSTALASSERVSRMEMARISSLYFDGIENLNGKMVPFDSECFRVENGMVTAGTFPGAPAPPPGLPSGSACGEGLGNPVLKTIYNIRPRRTPVVDEERGVTWGVYCFNHRGLTEVKMPDGKTYPTYFSTPNTMPIAEIFKIKNGKIRDIVAFGTILPYGIGDGWAAPVFK